MRRYWYISTLSLIFKMISSLYLKRANAYRNITYETHEWGIWFIVVSLYLACRLVMLVKMMGNVGLLHNWIRVKMRVIILQTKLLQNIQWIIQKPQTIRDPGRCWFLQNLPRMLYGTLMPSYRKASQTLNSMRVGRLSTNNTRNHSTVMSDTSTFSASRWAVSRGSFSDMRSFSTRWSAWRDWKKKDGKDWKIFQKITVFAFDTCFQTFKDWCI